MTNDEIIEQLNDLIKLDHDASKTYEAALERVDEKDQEVRIDLQTFMQDHLRHVTDLSVVITSLGGTPIEPGRDIKGVLLEGLTKLRSVTGTMGALKAMRMNEKLTNRSYEQAARKDLPPIAADLVEANLQDERRHLASIEQHIASRGAGTGAEAEVVEEEETVVAVEPEARV
ncbi:MAG: ferritin-like domain-containing protein [Deltaproteobacteria bacterium]|nr:ferritin-like domain-containing protein [Deltaproteobacteria bacterium]MCW5807198.1 ferritin-like domain-containing protein [Deltaproteobacteria bacterium]